MNKDCFFCNEENFNDKNVILKNDSFCARFDDFPITKGHLEIISKKHIESFFDLNNEELIQLFDLIKKVKIIIQKEYNPDAFNIWINEWREAWRTIDHLHIHIIPRYKWDVENPRGWIRNIIPWKGNY